jgi:hypothetical protein
MDVTPHSSAIQLQLIYLVRDASIRRNIFVAMTLCRGGTDVIVLCAALRHDQGDD